MSESGRYNLDSSQDLPDKARQMMEEGLKDIRANVTASPYPVGAENFARHPRGRAASVPAWTPRIDLGADDGEIHTVPKVVQQDSEPPDDEELLQEFELDPKIWEVVNIRKSRWQTFDQRWLEAHRVSVRRRGAGGFTSVETMDALLAPYLSQAQPSSAQPSSAKNFLAVMVGDLQIGKKDGGGTPGIIDRFGRVTEAVADQIRNTEDGHVGGLVCGWLGDCIEGIVAQQGRLATRLDLSVTEQVRVIRRLMLHQLATLAPLADRVLVPVLAGNHDESYRGVAMPVTDSWAIDAASAVADGLSGRPEFAHVQFLFPEEEELSVTVDVGSVEKPLVLGLTHGHIMGSSPDRALLWWQGQSHGRQSVGEADILFSAHWHHLRMQQTGGNRTWIQIPALDGGSDWYRRKAGEDCPGGLASVWLTPGSGCGWQGLTIHT